MARGSLRFAAPQPRTRPVEPLGLGQFTLLSICFGSLAALASIIIASRL